MRFSLLSVSICFFNLTVPSIVHAVVPCFHKDLTDYGKLIQPVVEYANSGSKRQTVEEYQHLHDDSTIDVAESTQATGKLRCKGGVLSANLVVKGDVILTAGHALVDPVTCNRLSQPEACTFTVTGGESIPISNLISSGDKCPVKNIKDSDWAILKLSRPVQGVRPYALQEEGSRDGVKPQPVVAVGDHSVDFRRKDAATGAVGMPKHIQDCAIERVYYAYDPVIAASKCDASYGASGGALLDSNLRNHVLLAVIVGVPVLSKAETKQEVVTGRPVVRNFDGERQSTAALGIEGRLRDELVKATR